MLSEILSLRTILVNVVFALASGNDISESEMLRLIERADGEKLKKAMQRLQPSSHGAQGRRINSESGAVEFAEECPSNTPIRLRVTRTIATVSTMRFVRFEHDRH